MPAGRSVAGAAALMMLACTRSPSPTVSVRPPNVIDGRVVRVSLGTMASARLAAADGWQLRGRDGRVVASGDGASRPALSLSGGRIRVEGVSGAPLDLDGPLAFSSRGGGPTSLNQRRYRGELAITATDSVLRVVNRVDLESYLRGVVPRELGVRGPNERAALEAQSVAARSYAVTRLGNATRDYDMVATTGDQVYGGMDAENTLADAAIAATEGLVLMYGGRVVSAPYFSTCGGSTAAPDELWRSRNEPFLHSVSDRIAGTDRHYCDIAPRFRWERSWKGDSLTAIVERYLRSYAQVPAGPIGALKNVSVDGRTPSGRVAAIVVQTERGEYHVRANDIRYVLRSSGGELLNSTYFSPEVVSAADGRLARLTLRGLGYGHGVGMCQWGAIGRARAGQDFRTILRTYFPGTSVARAY
ncbi:MAG TPA: SpoIID/LytB domain-containing protein [Gemmatimonadaceae bacterium]|nr:SpoIID/LytB domain-containing protein [Gemmatimonadaceae bacterium]